MEISVRLCGNSRLCARVSTQAAEFGNDPDCTNSRSLFLHKDSWFERCLPTPRVTHRCLLWQQTPLCVFHCVYMCSRGWSWLKKDLFFTWKASAQHFPAFQICHSHCSPTKMRYFLRQTSLLQMVERSLINGNPQQTDQHTQMSAVHSHVNCWHFWFVCLQSRRNGKSILRHFQRFLDPAKMPHNAITAIILIPHMEYISVCNNHILPAAVNI